MCDKYILLNKSETRKCDGGAGRLKAYGTCIILLASLSIKLILNNLIQK